MRTLSIPLTLGLANRVDAKFAPLGVLATATNLRVRKDGRLACRNGYVIQSADTSGGTLVAYDLHEYQGRLVALGSDLGDGYPIDAYEFLNLASVPWRGSDTNQAVTLNPFTNLRGLPMVQQIADGATQLDVAAGGGYVALVYLPTGGSLSYLSIARQSDGQIVHQEPVTNLSSVVKLTYVDGTFYLAVSVTSGSIVVLSYTPGVTASNAVLLATVVSGGTAVVGLDIVPVTNGDTAVFAVAYSKAADCHILKYDAAGTQVGSTIDVGLASVTELTLECDEDDDTINLLTRVTSTVTLRTYDFTAETLSLGATACTSGVSTSMCRLPTLGANVQAVAVAVTTSGNDTVIETFAQSDHSSLSTTTVASAVITGRLCEGQSGSQNRAVVFSGFVAPAFSPAVNFASDALFFVGASQAHMVVRNKTVTTASGMHHNLMLDESTGRLVWLGANNLSGVAQPSVVTVDFRSTKRRQSARYGGFLYLAGATVQAYDGVFASELSFNELPGIISATPDSGGSLAESAEYDYVHHWEYTRPDGTLERSPVSQVFAGNTGSGETENNLVLTTPHDSRVASSGSLFGAGVLSVLSRTVWDAANSTKGSIFRRCQVTAIPGGMANYGDTLAVLDNKSDADLADEAAVYTQGTRNALSGPLEDSAPVPCSYITADASRLFTGGLERPYEAQVSKPPSIEQPFAFSDLSAFFSLVSEEVKGVAALDGLKLVFTSNQIFALPGGGPDDQGGGALDPPQELPTPGGLKDWRSLLLAPDGLWFQLDDHKLYRLPRGGGSPEWVGVDVQDTLVSYPTITGAARCKFDDTVAFACANATGTDAKIVVRSLRAGLWTEDTPHLNGAGISAMCSFGDTLAYVSGGRVYVQSSSGFLDGSGSFISTQIKAHPIYPFELGGYGTIHGMLLTGEYRSAGVLALRVSYDDGITFTTYEPFTLSGLTAGQTVQRKWDILQSDTTSLVLELTFTPSEAGEGFIAHTATLLVDPVPGKLRELDPLECA